MQREVKTKLQDLLKQNIINKMLELHSIELPQALIEEFAVNLRYNMLATSTKQEISKEGKERIDQQPLTENFINAAKRQLRAILVFGALLKEHQIKPDQAAVSKAIEEMAEAYQDKLAAMNHLRSEKEILGKVQQAAIENQLVDMICEQATVVEKTLSYKEVIEQAAAPQGT